MAKKKNGSHTLGAQFTTPVLAVLFACFALVTATRPNAFVGPDYMGVNLDAISIFLSLCSFAVSAYVFFTPTKYKTPFAIFVFCSAFVILSFVFAKL